MNKKIPTQEAWRFDAQERTMMRKVGYHVEIPTIAPVDPNIISQKEALANCQRRREEIQEMIRTMPDILL